MRLGGRSLNPWAEIATLVLTPALSAWGSWRAAERKFANESEKNSADHAAELANVNVKLKALEIEKARSDKEAKSATTTEDLSMAEFMRGILEDQRKAAADALAAEQSRAERLLNDEKVRTEEIRVELNEVRAELIQSREATKAANNEAEKAKREAAGCRVDSQKLREELAALWQQFEVQKVNQDEVRILRRELEVALAENRRLRVNLNSYAIFRETHLAKEKANGGQPVPLDLSFSLDLDDEDAPEDGDPLTVPSPIKAGTGAPWAVIPQPVAAQPNPTTKGTTDT